MKDTIFISHANPANNDFARWLSLKLINLGYKVWADVLKLKGGNYTWGEVENEIRNNTVKFLFVTSIDSNQAEGCLNELSVADGIKRENKDDKIFKDFIVPLKIDDLPYKEMNIIINKLFAIDFTKSWALGFKDLIDKLNEDQIPYNKEYNSTYVSNWWNSIYVGDKKVIKKDDQYLSNWFPIIGYPENINFHKFGRYLNPKIDVKNFGYPAVSYSNYVATFAYCYDFMDDLPKSQYYSPENTISIKTDDIINGKVDTNLIQPQIAKSILSQLLKLGWEREMIKKGLLAYELSQKKECYYLKNFFNETNRIGRIKLVGIIKDRNWHYAVSAFPKYYPVFAIGIKAHIVFSDSENNIIKNERTQHSLRRKLGKSWWNFHWREKLSAMIEYLGNEGDKILLEVGSEEKILIDKTPIIFKSEFSYIDPEKEEMNFEEKEDIETDDTENDGDELDEEEFDDKIDEMDFEEE